MILLVQAESDGELDAAQAARLRTHREQCSVCQTAELELGRVRELLREMPYQRTPDAIRERVFATLEAGQPKHAPSSAKSRFSSRFRWWRHSAAGFGVGLACATAVALLVLSPAEQSLAEQVVASHVRALQPGHLEDVLSTDEHTVKPWFDGKIDFAPPVKDLASVGFPLEGGRLDYIRSSRWSISAISTSSICSPGLPRATSSTQASPLSATVTMSRTGWRAISNCGRCLM
jgi:anti-sigma factor RsiW